MVWNFSSKNSLTVYYDVIVVGFGGVWGMIVILPGVLRELTD